MKLKDLQNLSYSQEELLVNNEFNYRIRVGFLGLILVDEKTNKDILDSSDLLGVKRVKVIDEGEDAGVYTIKINKESKNTKEYLKKTAMDLYKKDMFRDKDNIKIGEVL